MSRSWARGTSIATYRRHSIFTWNQGKFTQTIFHPAGSNIPELSVGNGFTGNAAFCARFAQVENRCFATGTAATELPLPMQSRRPNQFRVGDKLVHSHDGVTTLSIPLKSGRTMLPRSELQRTIRQRRLPTGDLRCPANYFFQRCWGASPIRDH